jgi:hypothetical protein
VAEAAADGLAKFPGAGPYGMAMRGRTAIRCHRGINLSREKLSRGKALESIFALPLSSLIARELRLPAGQIRSPSESSRIGSLIEEEESELAATKNLMTSSHLERIESHEFPDFVLASKIGLSHTNGYSHSRK